MLAMNRPIAVKVTICQSELLRQRPEQPKKRANIFGDAKPVDTTAARERQIEERMRKDREEVASRGKEYLTLCTRGCPVMKGSHSLCWTFDTEEMLLIKLSSSLARTSSLVDYK
ncbi:hypothetical protein EB796_014968 [Bugula neritina]|uniref:Uncharacterized protein n=1 Tax=Bugula neritina TaxID=10212 RepID=A0A7J7JMS1_BUGNE|nr:hypothetical protein EB796_014968 [Bugula neritina]